MDALDFAQLQCVNDETNIAIARKPNAVVLIMHFVAVAYAVLFHAPVTAHIQNCRRGFLDALGHIKIGGDVQSRLRLEMHFPNLELCVLQYAGDLRLEGRSRGHWIEPQHLMHLALITHLARVPVFERLDFPQAIGGNAIGFVLEVGCEHPVTRCLKHGGRDGLEGGQLK